VPLNVNQSLLPPSALHQHVSTPSKSIADGEISFTEYTQNIPFCRQYFEISVLRTTSLQRFCAPLDTRWNL